MDTRLIRLITAYAILATLQYLFSLTICAQTGILILLFLEAIPYILPILITIVHFLYLLSRIIVYVVTHPRLILQTIVDGVYELFFTELYLDSPFPLWALRFVVAFYEGVKRGLVDAVDVLFPVIDDGNQPGADDQNAQQGGDENQDNDNQQNDNQREADNDQDNASQAGSTDENNNNVPQGDANENANNANNNTTAPEIPTVEDLRRAANVSPLAIELAYWGQFFSGLLPLIILMSYFMIDSDIPKNVNCGQEAYDVVHSLRSTSRFLDNGLTVTIYHL